jgi:hypothetical protein
MGVRPKHGLLPRTVAAWARSAPGQAMLVPGQKGGLWTGPLGPRVHAPSIDTGGLSSHPDTRGASDVWTLSMPLVLWAYIGTTRWVF